MTEKLLRLPEVRHMVRRSTTRIYSDMAQGTFPKPIRIGVRAVAWREVEISRWLAERIAQRDERQQEAA